MSWRTEARRVIDKALREAEKLGLTGPEREKLVRDRYPFGPKECYPYRVWLDEVSRTLKGKKTSLSKSRTKKATPKLTGAWPMTETQREFFDA